MANISEERILATKSSMIDAMVWDELGEEGVADDREAVRELCLEYGGNRGGTKNGGNSEIEHYLVDGAVLICDKATLDPVYIDGRRLEITDAGSLEGESPEDRKSTLLHVSENATYINTVRMATVKDHEMGEEKNIAPFRCNCIYPPNEEEEHEIIVDWDNYAKYGTCRKLMKLNDDWENILRDTQYMTYSHGDGDAVEEVEGVTMLSMLFCSHGGIITPVESGQSPYVKYLDEPDRNDPEQIKEYMMYFFLNKGLSCEVVAGILGNVSVEVEDFDLNAAESKNPNRFGMFQWSTNEKDATKQELDKWLAGNNLDIRLISTQCEYAYVEMNSNLTRILDAKGDQGELICNRAALLQASSAGEAALIFAAYVERCYIKSYIDDKGYYHFVDIQGRDGRVEGAEKIYEDMMKQAGGQLE